jgi:hypothetical protein
MLRTVIRSLCDFVRFAIKITNCRVQQQENFMKCILIWPAFFLLAAMIGSAAPLRAQDTKTVEIFATHQSLSPATDTFKIEVPPFSVEHQVRLSLEARVDWPTLAGSNPWLNVVVNGTALTQADLLNKPNDFKVKSGLDLTWYKSGSWRILYAPDFEIAKTSDSTMAVSEVDPYRFVWDITRYVKPGENELKLVNLQKLTKPTTMVFRDGKIEVGKAIAAPEAEKVTPAPTGAVPTFIARGAQKIPMQVRVSQGGDFSIFISGQNFLATTRTSLPDGKWRGALQAGSTPDAKGALIKTGKSQTANWQTANYKVVRKIFVRENHIHIEDTFTNTTPELIGIIVENRLQFSAPPLETRTAGWLASGEWDYSRNAAHPSVFAQWKDLGMGLVAEDDVFRIHNKSFREPGSIGLADEQLGIAPGASTTLEWSIYPTPKNANSDGDYWSLINAVRSEWGANYAIPGPFGFTMHLDSKKSAEELGQWMRARDLKIVAGGIAKYKDGKYAHGTGILFAPEFVAYEKEWIAKVHQTAPEVKALCYFHSQISTEPEAETKYAADRLFNGAGEAMSYPYRYPLPMFISTRENKYGKALWGYVKTILDDIDADGLYWDEMSHSVLEYSQRAPWDGHTVVIDPKTHAVTGKNSSIQLLMQPLQLDIINYLKERKKYLMANTQPLTRTMLNQKIVRFVETNTYAAVINTHLGCPLGLGNHHEETTQADAARHVRRILQQGGVYYAHIFNREPPSWNFMSVMYPITPARLGPGFVIGKERIHTTVSGKFGWPDGARANVYVVDADGARVEKPNVKEITESGKRVYEIRLPSDQFAVLVRQ